VSSQVNAAPIFKRVALIGFGLIGGSIARGAKLQGLAGEIVTSARSEKTRARVAELGIVDRVVETNAEAVKDADAPKDWDDLIDPKWKGKIVIRDPIASGTMRAIFGAIMARSIAQTGKPDAGYEWLRKLDANTREYTLNPTILYQKLGRQEGVVTMWDMPDFATLEQRTRIPIKYVIPASGTPLLVDGIAIVRGSKHPKEAEMYYEYVTTPEAMIAAADSFLRIPARKDIPVSKLPSWIRDAMAQIKPMPVDRVVMAAHLDEWMKYWDANIRNRGHEQ